MENELIPKEAYAEIEQMITSAESVVGIDAKKTHIIIIHKLMEIEKRLKALESK
ncbi:hypothetical protein [Marinoscillum sp.]|uniref:hypothetical protein n=1 Tax=Marinoscillum sp. TaxID=2024838 RepID=UPI003BAD0EF5